MTQKHPRACPSHDRFHALAHDLGIAVDLTIRTCGLRIAEHAPLGATRGIDEEGLTLSTRRVALSAVMSSAVHAHHRSDGRDFARAANEARIRFERDDSWHDRCKKA